MRHQRQLVRARPPSPRSGQKRMAHHRSGRGREGAKARRLGPALLVWAGGVVRCQAAHGGQLGAPEQMA
jgi:hypothetical protein